MSATSDVCVSIDGVDPQKIFFGYNNKAVCDKDTRDGAMTSWTDQKIQRTELSSLVMEEGIHEW